MNIGFLYAIGAAVLWGLNYAIDEKVLQNLSPIVFLFTQSVITAVIMLPVLFIHHGTTHEVLASSKLNIGLILLSVLLSTVASFFILSGIKHLNASTASLIEIAYPFFVVLFSYLLFRSTPNMYFYLGGLLIFAGSVVIIKFA